MMSPIHTKAAKEAVVVLQLTEASGPALISAITSDSDARGEEASLVMPIIMGRSPSLPISRRISALRPDWETTIRSVLRFRRQEVDHFRCFRHQSRITELNQSLIKRIQNVEGTAHPGEYDSLVVGWSDGPDKIVQLLRISKISNCVPYGSWLIKYVMNVCVLNQNGLSFLGGIE
jgi:hypothetical protein